MKSTKKQLFTSALCLVVSLIMLLGTTFAWFTDTVTSGKNKIQAGNLDVELKHYTDNAADAETVEGATDLFGVDLWEPGVMAYENFVISNEGDLALNYDLALALDEADPCNKTTDGNDLSEVIKFAAYDGEFSADREAAKGLTYSTLDEIGADGYLLPGESKTIGVVAYWAPNDDDVDNLYNLNNGKQAADGKDYLYINLGVNLTATQYTYEVDSYDNTYDKGAYTAKGMKKAALNDSGDLLTNYFVEVESDIKVKSAYIPAGTNLEDFTDYTESDTNKIVLNVETVEVTDNSLEFDMTLTNETTGENITGLSKAVVVDIEIGKNLLDVAVTHNGTPMAAYNGDEGFVYDSEKGIVTIYTKSFSPFEITYEKAPSVSFASVAAPATVDFRIFGDSKPANFTAFATWNTKTAYAPAAAYELKATKEQIDGAADYALKDYHIDFVVKFDKDVEAGTLGLFGSYPNWNEGAWEGFEVPKFLNTIDANVMDKDGVIKAGNEIRLLAMTSGSAWSYEDIMNGVQTFGCGIADFNSANAGTTVTVELRMYEAGTSRAVSSESGNYAVLGTQSYTL